MGPRAQPQASQSPLSAASAENEGFSMNLPIDLVPGSAYSRSDLHDALGRHRQGGISTPARYPVILLFSSHRGAEFGYADGWNADDGFYHNCGEGQSGYPQSS